MANHPYHLVNPSPWPIFASFSAFTFAIGMVSFMHNWGTTYIILLISAFLLIGGAFFWWVDVISEAKYDKAHTYEVQEGLKKGMLIFICSELFFFATFFGAFFYLWAAPVHQIIDSVWDAIPGVWPPKGIQTIAPWGLPLLNTFILLLSSTTVAWAHFAIKENKIRDVVKALACTVALGVLFSIIQAYEYFHAGFGFKEEGYKAFYASIIYICTGFHRLHVIIGTMFLIVCLVRAMRGSLTKENHLGLEFASWYWHFVDVVWIFLFAFLYFFAAN